jgi:hypothetical protein
MTAAPREELDALSDRIARLAERPHEVKNTFAALARPVMRALRWKPSLATQAVERLAERVGLGEAEAISLRYESLDECAKLAREELEANVTSLERACVVHGRVPLAYASFLWRIHQIVRRVHEWTDAPSETFVRRALSAVVRADARAPLVAKDTDGEGVTQVGAIDPLLRAARDETELLGRRRRLLEAARTLLLDASAALDLDVDGTEARSAAIATEIALLDRLEAAGIAPEVGLAHQLRQALDRGETQRLHAALVALEGFALERGDGTLGTLTGRALDELWGKASRYDQRWRAVSLERSSGDILSPRVLEAVDRGLARAKARRSELVPEVSASDAQEAAHWKLQVAAGAREAVLATTLVTDGCFEVGGALSPVRVRDVRRVPRLVPFPTQHLVLAPARGVDDLPDAVIDDPRLVLLSLASGRLLARRYLAEELVPSERTVLAGEVRLYVLDGSTSMLGPRARMRDAILIAELSTLAARLSDAQRSVRPTLYYRYFTDKLDTLTVVEDEGHALLAIEQVLGTLRTGSTDIESALLASFERIRVARENDPDLARAQIVLVTDGDAPIDQDKVLAAREAVGSIPVGVSIIALGQENAALRALAARQRARGEPCFYHFTSDRALRELVDGARSSLPVHLPESLTTTGVTELVREVVEEIEQRARGIDEEAIARARHELAALAELGLSLDGAPRDAALARIEAKLRDARTLRRRFERWFPELDSTAREMATRRALPEPSEREDLDLVATLLGSVAEVVDLVGAAPLERQADAIEVFERLLADAGVPPWRYAALLEAHPEPLTAAIAAVRSSVRLEGAPAGGP